MAARSKARKRAVDVLYEADAARRRPARASCATGSRRRTRRCPSTPSGWSRASPSTPARIDELIDAHASNWSIDRLPDVDRAILRMATFELLWADDVPDVVVIDEAVELAKALSTDDSPAYVNGVLGAILAAEVPTA